ncbi:B12-binding domain-containing radical SAM protein [Salinarimonas rosea]|uniref:B12-binding domain-containing radical SAM protein n=1 Tax=Salinarimonas rosea TaxID=552063 RepID=UPI0004132DB5|nr:B12-binding domain-containing radical SAM protein [Salinarimonas rosea]
MSPSEPQIDCLLIGHNQMAFEEYAAYLRATGERSGAHRDVRLSYWERDGRAVTFRDYCNDLMERRGEPGDLSYDDMLGATSTYLGSFLHRRGHSFDFINSFREGRDRLRALLAQGRVRCVAVTTTYYVSALQLVEVIEFVRAVDPRVPIVVGGPFVHTQHRLHDTASFHFLLKQIGADVYVVGNEGEATLARLLGAMKANGDRTNGNRPNGIDDVPNLVRRVGATMVATPIVPEANALEDNMIDWRLFAGRGPGRARRMLMVRTAKSCPFSCSFCSFPEHAGAYTYLSPERVLEDLDAIDALGWVESVTFVDDTFNIPHGRFRTLLRGMAQRRYAFRWNCNFRCQYATEEVVALMKEAGCEGVFLGIESGSDAILATMNKRARAAEYRRGLALLRSAGIPTYASFVVGFPGETSETVEETIDFIEDAAPDFYRAQLWYYDLLTPIHREAGKYGLRNSQFEWSHATMTAEIAADWVDRMHATIRASVWLPQNDFDFPGLFCLLGRGWSVAQIKDAARAFNARVRDGIARRDAEAYTTRALLHA